MIGALDEPSEGKVFFQKIDLSRMDSKQIAWIRCSKIGYIFQSFNLIPVLSALENVTLPMVFAGLNDAEARDKGMDKLESVGLADRWSHRPDELSGGQRQRVAIARAIANDPDIILADEPTGNLDLKTGREIIHLLRAMRDERGVTIVTNTHDKKMISYSDRIVTLRDGAVSKISTIEEIKAELSLEGDVEAEDRLAETLVRGGEEETEEEQDGGVLEEDDSEEEDRDDREE
jgi:putative ABC transport system ATP-binding protein